MNSDFNGFKVVNMKFTLGKEAFTREIFVQEYAVKRPTDDKPQGKTLFAINIPPYVHEAGLKSAYSVVGIVENVILAENVLDRNENSITERSIKTQLQYFGKTIPINKFKVAYIVFKSTKSLKIALQMAELQICHDNEKKILFTGIEKWTNEYIDTLVNEKELEAEVNDYMQAFEEREQEAREEAKKIETDEDGWTVVKRGKIGGGFEQKESVLKALEEKIAKGKKKKEHNNFYAFQFRQSKQKHLVSLRKRFQEDKMKIEALKKARRFKPF